jgi:hypothetical protein
MESIIQFINGRGGKLVLILFGVAALVFGLWTASN